MRRRNKLFAAALVLSFAASAAAPTLPPPQEPLSDLARSVLKRKMGRHGSDYAELSTAVVLLRYEAVRDAAARISSEPRLVRPVAGGEDDVNASIPERFFVLQDGVRDKAQRLAAAARLRNFDEVQQGFAQLSAACASCHAAYKPEGGK